MKPFKPVRYGIVVCLILALSQSCKKDSPNFQPTPPPGTTGTDEMVLTPAGYMERSRVHFIGEGYHLSVENGRIRKFETRTGRRVEDFGEFKPLPSRIVPVVNGWIAYSYWTNPDTSKPITYYATSWAVPSAPSRKSTQTIFLFNGLQNGTTATSYIIQPVLQWGPSAAGGGKFWAIANWYVTGSSAFYGSLITVSAGTNLQGILQQTGSSGGLYNYNSSFTGYPSANAIQVNNLPQAYWAAETLESYNVVTPSTEYPPNTLTAMSSIQILQGSTNASISWSTAQASPGSAQKAVVISNSSPGGEVDIHYR